MSSLLAYCSIVVHFGIAHWLFFATYGWPTAMSEIAVDDAMQPDLSTVDVFPAIRHPCVRKAVQERPRSVSRYCLLRPPSGSGKFPWPEKAIVSLLARLASCVRPDPRSYTAPRRPSRPSRRRERGEDWLSGGNGRQDGTVDGWREPGDGRDVRALEMASDLPSWAAPFWFGTGRCRIWQKPKCATMPVEGLKRERDPPLDRLQTRWLHSALRPRPLLRRITCLLPN